MRPSKRVSAGAAASLVALVVTAAPVGATPADTVTVHERFLDVNPDSQNPCSGAMGTVTDDNDIHFHVTTHPDGSVEETGHNTAVVIFTPDDPQQPTYRGHETFASSDSSRTGRLVTTTTFSLHLRGDDGETIAIHEVAHTTVTSTAVTTSFDRAVLTCS